MAPRSSIIESLLAGSTKEGRGNDFFNYKNPYYMAGGAIDEMRMPAAQTTTQAVLLPILQGLAGGALSGYGARKAKEKAYDYYRKQPGLSSLYTSETRPEGWDADQGQLDQLRVLAQAEEVKKKQEEIEKYLMGKGLTQVVDPITGAKSIIADPQILAAQNQIDSSSARAKKTGELQGETQALGYSPKVEEETDKLRKEFSSLPEVKNYSLVAKTGGIMAKALKDPAATTDLELTRYAILLIEPGMAVREGEQSAVANSGSIPENWKGQLDKALKGESGLTEPVREGLRRLALRAYEGNKSSYDSALSFYKTQAKEKGLNPDRISYLGESPDSAALGLSSLEDTTNPLNLELSKSIPAGEKIKSVKRIK